MLHIKVLEGRSIEQLFPPDIAKVSMPLVVVKSLEDPTLLTLPHYCSPYCPALSKGMQTFVAVNHGSQAAKTASAHEPLNPVFNSSIELWDGELSETIELMVVCQFKEKLYKHSIVTMQMEEFRREPEKRFDLLKDLTALAKEPTLPARLGGTGDSRAAAEDSVGASYGTLHLLCTYTDDCFQPTFFQSLFCNAAAFGSCAPQDQVSAARERALQRHQLRSMKDPLSESRGPGEYQRSDFHTP